LLLITAAVAPLLLSAGRAAIERYFLPQSTQCILSKQAFYFVDEEQSGHLNDRNVLSPAPCHVVPFLLHTQHAGNESVPIQLAQCRFLGLTISNAEILKF